MTHEQPSQTNFGIELARLFEIGRDAKDVVYYCGIPLSSIRNAQNTGEIAAQIEQFAWVFRKLPETAYDNQQFQGAQFYAALISELEWFYRSRPQSKVQSHDLEHYITDYEALPARDKASISKIFNANPHIKDRVLSSLKSVDETPRGVVLMLGASFLQGKSFEDRASEEINHLKLPNRAIPLRDVVGIEPIDQESFEFLESLQI